MGGQDKSRKVRAGRLDRKFSQNNGSAHLASDWSNLLCGGKLRSAASFDTLRPIR